ncbi:transcriptional regulator [Mycolicibacterium canariasense]|uniref:Transcriptional regulator n=1 Tax=Mycolicibacterium canariasense TaxID=228230 RepID=A0A117IAH0_MYCCR|nr:TetR/AcrR family transcriptional regulator [Mycolicibacterium canariasense]MCV7209954.1 TetR/AcrR family transcriptional regulator [Mycolicibacterium canariasense]ORV05221.1 TetR family transcriptional regulator [Mycolicibacterium canariasense]GAS96364.1 transcriptional regulator [Mycolicibacterium canariasense]
MGRKGWGGAPPTDDAEARKRIIDATRAMIDERGAGRTALADVSEALGITRRTIYRYFTGTEELFTAVAEVSLEGFVAQVGIRTANLSATDQLVEVVAYIIERLPHEPLLELLLDSDRTSSFSRGMLTADVIARCRTMLRHTHIDWAAMGYDDDTLDELVEFLLRNIQSMIVAPTDPPRTGARLRAYLRRWIGPALKVT